MTEAGFLRRNRSRVIAVLAVGAVVVAAGFLWFRPDKLFVDDTVDQRFDEPGTTLASGPFEGLSHPTSGTARIVETGQGRELRLEDFRTDNGPDLVVWLSEAEPGGDYGSGFVDLGGLRGNVGNQAYAIPPDLDLDAYRSVVIWCRRFTVGFGVAGLSA